MTVRLCTLVTLAISSSVELAGPSNRAASPRRSLCRSLQRSSTESRSSCEVLLALLLLHLLPVVVVAVPAQPALVRQQHQSTATLVEFSSPRRRS